MTTSENPDDSSTTTSDKEMAESSLGDLLHKTRTAQQRTLENAAAETRINASFLYALEENDFDKLPDEIFTRGFIKIYATYLGLDQVDVLKLYVSQTGVDPGKTENKALHKEIINSELLDRTSIFIVKKSRKIMPVIILLTILVLFYVLGVYFKYNEESLEINIGTNETISQVDIIKPSNSPQMPVVQSSNLQDNDRKATVKPTKLIEKEIPVKVPLQAKQEITSETTTSKEELIVTKEKTLEKALLVPKTTVALPTEPIKQVSLPITVKVATESSRPLDQPKENDIDFKYVLEARFQESTLLSIRLDDRPQLSYNPQAGTTRTWKANNSIALDLENSAVVSLILNGKPLPITGNDGATVTINIPSDISKVSQ